MPSNLQEFSHEEFNEFIKSKKNGLVLFSAPWCTACKIVMPEIEKITAERSNLIFIKIDVSKNPGLAAQMGVMSLPNILIIKKGKVIDQIIGTASQKAIDDKLKKIA